MIFLATFAICLLPVASDRLCRILELFVHVCCAIAFNIDLHFVFHRVIDKEMPEYGEAPTSLWRRYSEFELLRNYLEVMYSAVVIPPLPEKRVCHFLICT